jgi:hypothetical protein
MATTRTRDVHWRLDPQVVRRLEEIAYANGVSVSHAANYLLGHVTRPGADEQEKAKVIPVENGN